MKRQERLERLRAVAREFDTGEFAVEVLRERLVADPLALSARGLRPRDADSFEENLEATYLIRMFAEFEAALRDVWANAFRQSSQPPTRHLIDRVAARRAVPDPDLEAVQVVRAYRNGLVHEGGDDQGLVPFDDARSSLGKFLARLPLDW